MRPANFSLTLFMGNVLEDQPRGKAFRDGDDPAFGIPNAVRHVMKSHYQNVCGGAFGGVPHLPANTLHVVPYRSNGNLVNLPGHSLLSSTG
jgi:hypothetical protein